MDTANAEFSCYSRGLTERLSLQNYIQIYHEAVGISTSKINQMLLYVNDLKLLHYGDVIMRAMASLITSVSIVYSTVCSGADQRKPQNSREFPDGGESLHKRLITRKMFPFDYVIIEESAKFRDDTQGTDWLLMCLILCLSSVIFCIRTYGM